MPGTIVDRYRVEARLGAGGMATVYRVTHTTLGTQHALKVLRWTDEELVQRLIREGRLQGTVNHANVLGVSDCVRIGDAPGLILEYISGWTLAELLAPEPLTPRQADWLARGILEGVAAAHEHGLVHRDLKPANILLSWEDGVPIPKIADFGLARAVDAATLTGGLTRGSLGTPGYMAPEQVIDASAADHRADVFSLGAVLYELVTGRRAFGGDNVYAVLEAARNADYAPPTDLPAAWEEAIRGALRSDPEKRIQTVQALWDLWSQHTESGDADWPTPPASEDAIWGASLVDAGAATHPDLDALLEFTDRPDIVLHLSECAACRMDRRLYMETFAESEPEPAGSPWMVPLVAGVAAVPVTLGVLTALFGELRSVDDGGVWGPMLLVGGVIESASLAVLMARQAAGREHPIWMWLAPCVLPIAIGSTGAALGVRMMARVLDNPEATELFSRGLPMALRVDWAGWILGAAGLLASSMAWTWHRRADRQEWRQSPLAAASIGGLILWGVAVWTGTDGAGSFLTWTVLLLVAGLVGVHKPGESGWPAAVLGIGAVACASRALHLGHLQAVPLADLFWDRWITLAYVAVALGFSSPLRASWRRWLGVLVFAVPAAGWIWVEWGVASARALLP